jgi:hypothetical protein
MSGRPSARHREGPGACELSLRASAVARQRREELGLNRLQFAGLCGISVPMVGALDAGRRNWSLWLLGTAAGVLQLEPWMMLRGLEGFKLDCPNCHGKPDGAFQCLQCGTKGFTRTYPGRPALLEADLYGEAPGGAQ